MPAAVEETHCADCATTTSNLLDVRRRKVCHACFIKYVATKIHKRMVVHRPQNQVGDSRRRLLLPLSGGISSMALLHAMDAQMNRQIEKNGRTMYELVLVHVHLDAIGDEVERWRTTVHSAFNDHEFLSVFEIAEIFKYDKAMETDLQSVGLYRQEDEDDHSLITRLFNSVKTATARSDLTELLVQRLLVAIAKEHTCEGILWGHSDSKLAAKVLSDVAKGRGGSVSNTLADGPSPWGINFSYPARDLYITELELYLQVQPDCNSSSLLLNTTPTTPAVSMRDTSIDALLTGYITSQGAKYPSIMANVVRTTGKLQVPDVQESHQCQMCRMPTVIRTTETKFCYGCDRLRQDIKL